MIMASILQREKDNASTMATKMLDITLNEEFNDLDYKSLCLYFRIADEE